jgi:Zn-dependent protease
MLQLIYQGQWPLFLLITIALVISLTFHEFGHAASAKLFGDDTAQKQGRLTLNPIAHIDPVGLLMVVLIGLVVLSVLGVPIFRYVRQVGEAILPLIVFY